MWTQLTVLLLTLLAVADAQSWNEPIKFNTKSKDHCTMTITGQGDNTRLRISCWGKQRTYYCDYVGKPQTCRSYNNNPRHYFTQMMWGLRKLQNACQGPKAVKPQMCKKGPEEAQMVLAYSSVPSSSASSAPAQPSAANSRQNKVLVVKPTLPIRRTRPTTTTTTASAASPGLKVPSAAKKIAEQYCWRSLKGVCGFVIGWFKN